MNNELGEFVNYEMEQTDEPCDPSTVETNEIVTDMTQEEKVKGTHPDIKRSYKVSDPTVEDHPVEQIENHKPSQKEWTDQLDTQIRTARIEHYIYSDKNQSASKASIYIQRRHLEDPTLR